MIYEKFGGRLSLKGFAEAMFNIKPHSVDDAAYDALYKKYGSEMDIRVFAVRVLGISPNGINLFLRRRTKVTYIFF